MRVHQRIPVILVLVLRLALKRGTATLSIAKGRQPGRGQEAGLTTMSCMEGQLEFTRTNSKGIVRLLLLVAMEQG